jgi:hypothetical protein
MGFVHKIAQKGLAFGNKLNPHTWALGERQSAAMDLGGQVAGAHDDLYKPKDIAAAPSADTSVDAYTQRDFARRLAKRASGRDSTIRTSPAGAALYSAQPKSLLGS